MEASGDDRDLWPVALFQVADEDRLRACVIRAARRDATAGVIDVLRVAVGEAAEAGQF